MIKMKILHTDKAPGAVGPYCQAVQVGDMIFTSGQLAIDPANGNLINDDIEKATRRSLDNVKAILEEAGNSMVVWPSNDNDDEDDDEEDF